MKRLALLMLGWFLIAPPGDLYLNLHAPLYEWHVMDGPFRSREACEATADNVRKVWPTLGATDDERDDALIRYWGQDAQHSVSGKIVAERIRHMSCVNKDGL